MLLNEIYIGKEPILPIERQLGKIRRKFVNKKITATTNVDKDILKFNRMVEAVFGFKTFALYIQPDHIPNAYAFPVDLFFTDEEKIQIRNSVMASPSGFRYDKAFFGVNMISAIHYGLLTDFIYTDGEIMSILLHEIGHGFFEAVTNEDSRQTTRKFLEIIAQSQGFIMKALKKRKSISQPMAELEIDSLPDISRHVRKYLGNSRDSMYLKEDMESNMTPDRISYTNEKFADTFAASYGYGPEIHSALMKMGDDIYSRLRKPKRYPKIIETLYIHKLLIKDFFEYIAGIQDEHPTDITRASITAKYLQKELSKDSIDPKMKKEIMEQLAQVNQLIENYQNFPQDQDSQRIIRLYHIALYKKFGGDRREQDTDNKALFDKIDSRYRNLEKEKSKR